MPAYEVIIQRRAVVFTDDPEEAQTQAVQELDDAWNDGYDYNEMFEIEVKECADEPGVGSQTI